MAIEERFTAVISARDETAATMRAIGARFQSLSRDTGMTRLASSIGGVTTALGGLLGKAIAVAGPMAVLGTAAAIGGLAALAVRTAGMGDDLGDLSDRTGIAIRDLQSLGDVASRAGIDQDSLATSLQKLNRGLADAATGGNAELANVMRQLGISMRGSNGEIRSAAELLPQLSDAFARNENQALRVRLATELFGRSGEAMIPMLAQGSAALREGQERWDRYGFSLAASSEQMSGADGQFRDMGVAIRGMADAIGVQLAPVLGPIAADIALWVVANRDVIATGFGDWVRETAVSIRGFFAESGPIDRLQSFGTTLQGGVEMLGGYQNILIGFGALAAAPFVAALATIVTAFVPLGVAIGSFGLALAVTPVGWFLGAVAAVGAAAYVIYSNWEGISGWFSGIWTGFRDGMAPQVDWIVGVISGAGGIGAARVRELMAAWEPVTAFFAGIWNGVGEAFAAGWRLIAPVVDLLRGAVSLLNGTGTGGSGFNPTAQAGRSANQAAGGARRIEGWDDDAGPLGNRPLPSPLSGGAGAGAGAQQGQVDVRVSFDNAPAGMRVDAGSSGALVQQPRTDVGYALGRVPQ